MIRSMTGFGRAERRSGGLVVGVEIRSVNHRHTELRVKVPSSFTALEEPLRQKLAASVTRGRVDATVSVAGAEEAAPVEINHAAIGMYLKAADEVRKRHGLDGAVDLRSVLTLPGVITLRGGNGSVSPDQKAAIETAFEEALKELEKTRGVEGKHLAADLEKRLKAIEKHRAAIGKRAAGLPARFAKKLAARVAEIDTGRSVDPGRLAQEVALLASRSDITEELVRLEGHVAQALGFLKASKEPVGKRLDFLLQEMHREANTINSKSEDLEISRDALAIKAEIEKIREQAQNIE